MKISKLLVALCSTTLAAACTSVPLKTSLDGRSCPAATKSLRLNMLDTNANAPLADPALLTRPLSQISTPSDKGSDLFSVAKVEIALARQDKNKTQLAPDWLTKYESRTNISPAEIQAANKAVAQVNLIRAHAFGALAEIGEQPAPDTVVSHTIKFTRKDADLLNSIQEISSAGGYEIMYLDGRRELNAAAMLGDKSTAALALQKMLVGRFLADYFYAYARSGKLLQVSLAVGDTQKKISEKAEDALKDLQLNDDAKKKLADAITAALKGVCKADASDDTSCLLTKPLGADAFISRAGMSVQFAGIDVTLGKAGALKPATSYPKPKEFGPQLARVFLEAVFDSVIFVPASANSTACTVNNSIYSASGLCLKESDPRSKAISNVDIYSAQTEATVSALAGKMIRGGSWVALNNEAVADTVETMAGVTARKLSEAAIWKLQENGSCSETGNPFVVSVEN